TVTCSIERLGFIEGSYWIDVAAHDERGTPFDYILKRAEFFTASPIKDVGMARPVHRWIIN
ncbi:MAG: ABC transporter ATP-binding protein, partial [Oscillospiraceae bacterium]|nr:ABC transporter ATP-binding protein [Oscillospiraceae bacterium]